MSSFPLTNSYFSEGLKPPTTYCWWILIMVTFFSLNWFEIFLLSRVKNIVNRRVWSFSNSKFWWLSWVGLQDGFRPSSMKKTWQFGDAWGRVLGKPGLQLAMIMIASHEISLWIVPFIFHQLTVFHRHKSSFLMAKSHFSSKFHAEDFHFPACLMLESAFPIILVKSIMSFWRKNWPVGHTKTFASL